MADLSFAVPSRAQATPIAGCVRWMGQLLPIVDLANHYRLMARTSRTQAAFWRTRARAAIQAYREQQEVA